MKVGDMVVFEGDRRRQPAGTNCAPGIIVAKLPADSILAAAVSVLWSSGELTERVAPRILEVIDGDR